MENCLWPTLETVHAGSDQWRIHARCSSIALEGINRSAGVLCAWLVVGYNYSAEDAVQLLLEKRPALRPWHNRPYVLEALWQLEGLSAQWHMELSDLQANEF